MLTDVPFKDLPLALLALNLRAAAEARMAAVEQRREEALPPVAAAALKSLSVTGAGDLDLKAYY